jgi:phage tail sheath protein FI
VSTYPRPGVFVSESLLPSTRIQRAAAATAAGAAVGSFPRGTTALTLCGSWYEFTSQFGGLDASYPGTYVVRSFFSNGGRDLYVQRLLADDAAEATISVPVAGGADPCITFTARNKGTEGNAYKVTISAGASSTWNVQITETVTGVSAALPRESYVGLVLTADSADNVATVINTDSLLVTCEVDAADHSPEPGTYTLTGGDNGTAVSAPEYIAETGSPAMDTLTTAARPLALFFPSLHTDVTESSDRQDIYAAAVSWAEANYGFVVVDTPAGLALSEAINYVSEVTPSSSAALYWPCLVVPDPLGRSRRSQRIIGSAGAVAGTYLATDASRGVFKAPAGIEATLAGVAALEVAHKPADLNALYAGGVNAIRQIPGAGIVVMGARTLSTARMADQYIPIRRTLSFLEKSLYDLTEFAVFENNNELLWARLRTVVDVFLSNFWAQGGLAGSSQASAYYCKCDAENNPLASVQNGEVNIEVGVAVQYPTEFVVIRLSQQAGV